MVPLGEVCEVTMGQAPPGDSYNTEGLGSPLIAGPGDFGVFSPEIKKYTTKPGKICAPGDFVLGIRASIGALNKADREYCIGRGVAGLHPKVNLDSRYLWNWMNFASRELASKGKGATFKQVSRSDIVELQIPLPLLPEQRRIAAILDQADDLRRKRSRLVARLAAVVPAIFNEVLNGPDISTEPLADVAEIWDCPHSTPRWTATGLLCLRTPNLTRGGWNWSDSRYVDETQFNARSKGGGAQTGDIILSREGTVGIAAVVSPGMQVCMGQRLVQVRPKPEVLTSEWALEFLLAALHPDRISTVMVGSTSQHLNVKDLRALPIPIPCAEIQKEFAERASAIGETGESAERATTAGDALFVSLQARAFRGEL